MLPILPAVRIDRHSSDGTSSFLDLKMRKNKTTTMPPSRVAAADDEDEDEDGPDCYDVPDDANDEEGKLDQRVILLLDLDCFYAQEHPG